MPSARLPHTLVRPMLLIALALVIPILPFLIVGESFETRVEAGLDESLPAVTVAAAVVGLLTSDILLPIPSSVVSTFAGRALGFWGGTGATWLGMTLGAAFGFALARALGRPLAARLSTEEDWQQMDRLAARFGPWILVAVRPVPVLAEAGVLFFGVARLSWSRFLLAVGLSNLGIAAAYAALGTWVKLPMALAASIIMPLVVTAIARLWWLRRRD